MPAPAIEVDGLTKRFGHLVAVDSARFEVPTGSLFGFLGPNGSGKTTTLGMVTGLIPPDSGTARVHGVDVRADWPRAISQVGALIEEPAFYPHLSGRRNLRLVGRLVGASVGAADEAIAKAGLADAADRKYKGYSQGMRRRLGLAAALLGNAPVIVLDEPTNGLDPAGQREVLDALRALAREGRTVVVSSHVLHEVQEVCTHAAVIAKGRILASGPLADILGGDEEIVVEVDDVEAARGVAEKVAGVRRVVVDGSRLRVSAPLDLSPDVNRALVTAGVRVRELTRRRPELSDRFLEMTKGAGA